MVGLRFGGGVGSGADFMTGEFKKADGDGMVIVSISGPCVQPLTIPKIARPDRISIR